MAVAVIEAKIDRNYRYTNSYYDNESHKHSKRKDEVLLLSLDFVVVVKNDEDENDDISVLTMESHYGDYDETEMHSLGDSMPLRRRRRKQQSLTTVLRRSLFFASSSSTPRKPSRAASPCPCRCAGQSLYNITITKEYDDDSVPLQFHSLPSFP